MADDAPTPELSDFDIDTLRQIVSGRLREFGDDRKASVRRLIGVGLLRNYTGYCTPRVIVCDGHMPCLVLALAERARRAEARAPHWRPIETAPRDGTRVLLFANGSVGEAVWSGADRLWRWSVHWLDGDGGGFIDDPTYWQPLPEPPGKETADG